MLHSFAQQINTFKKKTFCRLCFGCLYCGYYVEVVFAVVVFAVVVFVVIVVVNINIIIRPKVLIPHLSESRVQRILLTRVSDCLSLLEIPKWHQPMLALISTLFHRSTSYSSVNSPSSYTWAKLTFQDYFECSLFFKHQTSNFKIILEMHRLDI